ARSGARAELRGSRALQTENLQPPESRAQLAALAYCNTRLRRKAALELGRRQHAAPARIAQPKPCVGGAHRGRAFAGERAQEDRAAGPAQPRNDADMTLRIAKVMQHVQRADDVELVLDERRRLRVAFDEPRTRRRAARDREKGRSQVEPDQLERRIAGCDRGEKRTGAAADVEHARTGGEP